MCICVYILISVWIWKLIFWFVRKLKQYPLSAATQILTFFTKIRTTNMTF